MIPMTKWNVSQDRYTKRWIANKEWHSETFPTQQTAFRYAYLHACADHYGVA